MALVLSSQSVVIANAASLSGAAVASDRTLLGLITPADWDAGAITFKVSNDGVTYYPLFDSSGTEVSIPSASIATAESRAFSLDPAVFVGWKHIKIQSGVNALAVAQTPARTIILIFREVG